MVRLKVEPFWLLSELLNNFNSLMVRLKEIIISENRMLILFQFLDGAIKSVDGGEDKFEHNGFQFLDGAIKSKKCSKLASSPCISIP